MYHQAWLFAELLRVSACSGSTPPPCRSPRSPGSRSRVRAVVRSGETRLAPDAPPTPARPDSPPPPGSSLACPATQGRAILNVSHGHGPVPRGRIGTTENYRLLTRLKKGAFDETLPGGRFRGRKPRRNRPVLLSHKTVYHIATYGSQKEDGWTQPRPGWKCGRNHDQVLGVCTGRRMAQPEADRWPLRLRAMPPGRLWRKRQNPYPTGRHNDRAGRCGRVCRLRGAVVGGTGGQRSSVTTPDIGWHYSQIEGAVTLLSDGTHTSSVCTSWATATRAHCE